MTPRPAAPSLAAVRAPVFLLLAALAGCALGPNYRRPQTPMSGTFRGQARTESDSFADLPFWQVFRDDKLVALLREALAQSQNLQAAAARVEQARAVAGISRDALYPAVSVQAGPSYQQVYSPFIPEGRMSNLRYALYQLQGTLSWELDLWGRLRRLREAALAEYLASEEARRGVILSLVGDIAESYFQLLTLDRQLFIARRTVAARKETLRLFAELESGGVGNRLQTASEEANLARAAAEIPEIERKIAAKENQIAILVGRTPGPIARTDNIFPDYEAGAVSASRPQLTLPVLPSGLPASLLERRPDLRQAEAGLIAANAQVGAAFAQFFPQLTLFAHGGLASSSLLTLFGASAATFGIGLAAGWLMPILNGYQIKHRYRSQQANWQALVAAYRQAVLSALSEVSNALISIDKLAERRTQLEAEVRARIESVALAKDRFRNGVASYLDVIQAEQNLFPAELDLAEAIGAEFVARARLYRALGGGWQTLKPAAGR